MALSVDGLNTIDARHTAAADARKWVIEPYQTVTISGWQVNSAEARRFEFTTEARSYGQALGQTANLGVHLGRLLQGTRAGDRPRVVPGPQRYRAAPRAGRSACGIRVRSAASADASGDEVARSEEVRRHGNGPANRSRRDAGVAGSRVHAGANSEHPLRVPSATDQARRSAGHSDRRPAAASRARAWLRGRLQSGGQVSHRKGARRGERRNV